MANKKKVYPYQALVKALVATSVLSVGERRNRQVVKMRDANGKAFSEIGKAFGISRQHAHQIYHRMKKKQESPNA